MDQHTPQIVDLSTLAKGVPTDHFQATVYFLSPDKILEY